MGGKPVPITPEEVTFVMPCDTRASRVLLRVEVDGYEPWSMEMGHKVNYSRHAYLEFVMTPTVW